MIRVRNFGKILAKLLIAVSLFNFVKCYEIPELNLLKKYDFIVVGGGSAGAVVTNRLTKNPDIQVLLLEAGGQGEASLVDPPNLCRYLQLTENDWQYKTEPQNNSCLAMKNRQCLWPRGKLLGGSSAINYMQYSRGNQHDYDRWSTEAGGGWSYNDVLPYFRKSENISAVPSLRGDKKYHGTDGFLMVEQSSDDNPLYKAFLKAGPELGYKNMDLEAGHQTGVARILTTISKGVRQDTNKAFLKPIATRKNLQIITNAHVTKITFNKRKRATGVKFQYFGKTYRAMIRKEVIVSGGVINSPQLLMLSGVGPKRQLKKFNIKVVADLPGVGMNMQDHLAMGLTFVMDKPKPENPSCPAVNNYQSLFMQWATNKTGNLAVSVIGVVGYVQTSYVSKKLDWPDIQIHVYKSSELQGDGLHNKLIFGMTDSAFEKYFVPIADKSTFTFTVGLIRPRSRGFIELRSSNPFDHPAIHPPYFTDPEDMANLVEGAQIAINFSKTDAFKPLKATLHPLHFPGCEKYELYSNQYLACLATYDTFPKNHEAGTCKMGKKNDTMAVVDKTLKVFKVKGVRVADASIMPYMVSSNTNAPSIMIGEMAADLINYTWNL